MATLEEDSVFTCSICLEQFTNPKYLPCLHTFCELCITSFIASAISDCEVKQEKKRFLCPVCRSENYPPVKNITAEEWAKKLPKNYQLQSLANTLSGKIILKPVFCESCRNNHEEKIATLRCKQCQNNLCEKCCTFIHKRVKGFLLHTIVDLRKSDFHNDLLGGQGLCSDHPDKEIIVYCSDHEKLCCTFCLTAKHSDCENLLSLDEIEQEDVKLYTETLNGETQKMREISKTALHEMRENIKSLHLEKDKILSSAAKNIQKIKDRLDDAYFQLEISLNSAHGNTTSKLTKSLETLELFDETLSQATKFATAVIHNGSKKQMFVVLTKLHERISSQFKNLMEERNDLKLAQLKWDCVDTIENFATLTNLGDFEYVLQPNDWSTEIDRHINNITKDANPKELVCRELKMKEIIPRRILAGLSTDFSEKPIPSATKDVLLVVAISIESSSWSWRFSFTSDWLKVYQKIRRKSLLSTPSLLLNPDETFKAFGYEARELYFEFFDENERQTHFFFENITTMAETGECLNEHTKSTDTSGKKLKVMELFRLAYEYMVRDCIYTYKERTKFYADSDIRIMLILPSHWNNKTQLFLRESVEKTGMQVHSIVLEAEAAFFYYQHLTEQRSFKGRKISFEEKYLIADFGGTEETLTLTIHVKHEDGKKDPSVTNLSDKKDRHCNEILKSGFVQCGLQSFISELEACINEFIGDEAMQKLKTNDMFSYPELMEAVIRILKNDSEDTNVRFRFPFASIDELSSLSTFKKAIDLSVHAGKIYLVRDVVIWNKEDFHKLFDKPIKRIIHSFMKLPACDMEEIETIIMIGTLAECPLVQNAVQKSFNTKRIVVLTDDQVKSGAVYIGHMS